jgi:hypothetical protein
MNSPIPAGSFVPPPLRAEIWAALQRKEAAALAAHRAAFDVSAEPRPFADPLTPSERKLYEHLTERLILDASVVGITVSDSPPSP